MAKKKPKLRVTQEKQRFGQQIDLPQEGPQLKPRQPLGVGHEDAMLVREANRQFPDNAFDKTGILADKNVMKQMLQQMEPEVIENWSNLSPQQKQSEAINALKEQMQKSLAEEFKWLEPSKDFPDLTRLEAAEQRELRRAVVNMVGEDVARSLYGDDFLVLDPDVTATNYLREERKRPPALEGDGNEITGVRRDKNGRIIRQSYKTDTAVGGSLHPDNEFKFVDNLVKSFDEFIGNASQKLSQVRQNLPKLEAPSLNNIISKNGGLHFEMPKPSPTAKEIYNQNAVDLDLKIRWDDLNATQQADATQAFIEDGKLKAPRNLRPLVKSAGKNLAVAGADIALDVAIDQIPQPEIREPVRAGKDAAALFAAPIVSLLGLSGSEQRDEVQLSATDTLVNLNDGRVMIRSKSPTYNSDYPLDPRHWRFSAGSGDTVETIMSVEEANSLLKNKENNSDAIRDGSIVPEGFQSGEGYQYDAQNFAEVKAMDEARARQRAFDDSPIASEAPAAPTLPPAPQTRGGGAYVPPRPTPVMDTSGGTINLSFRQPVQTAVAPAVEIKEDPNAEYKKLRAALGDNPTQAEMDAVRDFGLAQHKKLFPQLK